MNETESTEWRDETQPIKCYVDVGQVTMPVLGIECPSCGHKHTVAAFQNQQVVAAIVNGGTASGPCPGCGETLELRRKMLVQPNKGPNRRQRRAIVAGNR